ncbi:DUF4384 domain-containing protein (plasmid) [Azospirillum sp. TSA2s]|uniref:DUF4384 domain-containing protein n=1 Tax=Azospirillum sp. TSA2s TaxID=709810 RepID=UPI0010AAFD68|nr:DUF4384 domain-containing protein [Azospirillum sp. TSA2s]QCG93095.1 DUF4384 domain-containing protein [Azospirillum sp. TSA2s]
MLNIPHLLSALVGEAITVLLDSAMRPGFQCVASMGDADDDDAALNRSKRNRMLAYAGGGVGLLALAGGAVALVLNMGPSDAEVLAQINAVTGKYECAQLGVEMGPSRSVRLSGFARSAEDLTRLGEEVRAIKGVGPVEIAATEVIYPHCAVAILFSGLPAVAPEAGPKLDLQSADDTITVGSLMKLNLRNVPFDGYLYVDFYDRQQKVFHLVPGPAVTNNRFPANASMVLGEEKPGGRVYKTVEPLGQQVIMVTASREPLALGNRPEIEDAKGYLAALEPLLTAAKPDSIASSIKTLTIVAK